MSTISMDTIRLDRLGDPSFKFVFKISADGCCHLHEPVLATVSNLREAIDEARCKQGEMPFCIRCRKPLNESHREIDGMAQRFTCPVCKTSFVE